MANPIPTLVTGNDITQANWTTLTQLNTAIGLYGSGSSTAGGFADNPPAPGALVQAGTSVVTLSGGSGSISFPSAFPNGLFMVMVCNGDSGASSASVDVAGSGVSLSGFGVFASGVSGAYRVNWIAIGF